MTVNLFKGLRRKGVDTQAITEQQWRALLAAPTIGAPHLNWERREHERHFHRGIIRLTLKVGRSRRQFLVRARDVSDCGIGFVHGEKVERDTRCDVELLTRSGRLVHRTAVVMSCGKRDDGCFSVGLRLDKAIIVSQFMFADTRAA